MRIVMTRMCLSARSRASGSVIPTTPPSDAEEAARPICPSKAADAGVRDDAALAVERVGLPDDVAVHGRVSGWLAAGMLSAYDVLVVPSGSDATASTALGAAGRKALVIRVQNGGTLITLRDSSRLASRLKLTSADAPQTSTHGRREVRRPRRPSSGRAARPGGEKGFGRSRWRRRDQVSRQKPGRSLPACWSA
jgi:hypothetical protein